MEVTCSLILAYVKNARIATPAQRHKIERTANVALLFVPGPLGLTLGRRRLLMHGVAPRRCGQGARPLLGGGAGGRSPGLLCFVD